MKCPKCKYVSFEYLDECKKCGRDLMDHKKAFNIYAPRVVSLDILSYLEERETNVEPPIEDAAAVFDDQGQEETDFTVSDEVDLSVDQSDMVGIDDESEGKADDGEEIDLNLEDNETTESPSSESEVELEGLLDTEGDAAPAEDVSGDLSADSSVNTNPEEGIELEIEDPFELDTEALPQEEEKTEQADDLSKEKSDQPKGDQDDDFLDFDNIDLETE